MAQIYKGYAQASGIDRWTVDIPDTSQKILDQAAALESGKKRAFAQEIRNQQAYLDGLENKFKKEDQNRAENFKFEQMYSDMFFKEDMRNAQTKIQHARVSDRERNAKRIQAEKDLQSLIGTASKVFQHNNEKYKQSQLELAQHFRWQFGLSNKDIRELNTLEGELESYESKNIASINDLRDQGASWDQIKAMRNLSSYGQLMLRKEEAVDAGKGYYNWLTKNYSRQVELANGQKMSLAQTHEFEDTTHQDAVLNRLSKEYRSSIGLDADFQLKYMREPMRKAHSRFKEALEKKKIKSFQENEIVKTKRHLKNSIHTQGASGYIDLLNMYGGVDLQGGKYVGPASNRLHGYVKEMLEEGTLKWDFVNKLKDHPIKMKGQKDLRLYSVANPNKFAELEQAAASAQRKEAERMNAKMDLENTIDKNATEIEREALYADYENLTDSQILEKIKLNAGRNEHMHKMLTGMLTTFGPKGINTAVGEWHLNQLNNLGLLTEEEVVKANMTPEKTGEWLTKAREASPFNFTTDERTLLKGSLGDTLKQRVFREGPVGTRQNPTLRRAEYDAMIDAQADFKIGMAAYNNDRTKARQFVEQEFMRRFNDPNGKYRMAQRALSNGTMISEPHFPHYLVKETELEPLPVAGVTAEEVRKDPDLASKTLFLPPLEIDSFFTNINQKGSKGYPASALLFVRKYGRNPDGTVKMTEMDFMLQQYKALHGQDAEIPKQVQQFVTDSYNSVKPEDRALLQYGKDSVTVALQGAGKPSPYITGEEDKAISIIEEAEGTSNPPTGDQTIQEVVVETGDETILQTAEEMGLDINAAFTKELYNKMIIHNLKTTGLDGWIGGDVDDEDAMFLQSFYNPFWTHPLSQKYNISPFTKSLLESGAIE